jgi:RNA polymerase primary sigma factor
VLIPASKVSTFNTKPGGTLLKIDDTSEQLKQLIQIGKARGYILYDEIDGLLPAALEGDAHLDIVLTALTKNGVEIVEDPGATYDIDLSDVDRTFSQEDFDNSTTAIRMYLRSVMTIPRQTRIEEIELAKRIREGMEYAEDAERQLIEANLYLVVAIARRHHGPGYGLIDLIQEGNIGLMKAAEKYKHTSNYRFSTYAIWWIRRSIARSKLQN